MAECIILKGGGGADLDVVSAGAGDVTDGKVIVDKDGNPLTGTLPYYDSGTYWNRDLQLGMEADNFYSFFPVGRHAAFDSRGSLHRIPIARLQTAIGATSAKILSGQSIAGVAGGIAQMAGQTINPTASQQIVSTSGKYLTGNVTVKGVSNLTAANIKKGINVGGTVGNFEGYVPNATDLYLRGNNIVGATVNANYESFDSGQITVKSNTQHNAIWLTTKLTGYFYLNIEGYRESNSSPGICYVSIADIGQIGALTNIAVGNYSISFDVRNYQVTKEITIRFENMKGSIYRIWLS